MRHYGITTCPLTHLLKKNTSFIWTSECDTAFATPKECLTTAHVLVLPNLQQQFMVEIDASDLGIGVVLQQDGHPLAYLSKAFDGVQHRGWPIRWQAG